MTLRTLLPGLFASLAAGCAVSTPYRTITAPAGLEARTVVVAATHAVVRPEGREAFAAGSERVVASLERQPGLLGYSLRRHLWRAEFWTMTVRRDDAAREAFVAAPAHRSAVASAGSALAAVYYVHYEMPAADAPRWSTALERLREVEPAPSRSGR